MAVNKQKHQSSKGLTINISILKMITPCSFFWGFFFFLDCIKKGWTVYELKAILSLMFHSLFVLLCFLVNKMKRRTDSVWDHYSLLALGSAGCWWHC